MKIKIEQLSLTKLQKYYKISLTRFYNQTPCWEWTGGVSKNYGRIRVNGANKQIAAHTYSYMLFKGDLHGNIIDHLCRNTLCVNPEHLEAVSIRENTLRGTGPSALNSVKTHCPQGHVYNNQNTLVDKYGKRSCRLCNNIRRKKQHKFDNFLRNLKQCSKK